MSLDDKKLNEIEATEDQAEKASEPVNEPAETAPEPSEELTDLEKELFADMESSEDNMTFTATLHFEFSDIFNAIEHIEAEPEAEPEVETEAVAEAELEEPEQEAPAQESEKNEDIVETENPDVTSESEESAQGDSLQEVPEAEEPAPGDTTTEEPASEDTIPEENQVAEEPEKHHEETENPDVTSEFEEIENVENTKNPDVTSEPELPEPAEPIEPEATPAKPREGILSRYKRQDGSLKKLVLTDIILFAVIAISIIGGLIAANSLVKESNAATEQKIAEMQANVKEINLDEGLYDMAADQVIEDVAVPTYSLNELYALDLRKPTGFTANDLELITRRGLVGCEEAFVKAEETYGVNCIFLMSIASLESAYGTQMFRPNNMFGYGRTGFSSKQEGIMTVAKGLGTRYLNPGGSLYGGSPTLKGVNKRYAANPQWYYKVGKYMQGYYAELAAAKNGALDKFE